MKHQQPEVDPAGALYTMIKQDDHVLVSQTIRFCKSYIDFHSRYIEWKSKLEQILYEQYNITGSCDYAFAKEEFFFERVAMAFPPDSPWIQPFNREIKKILQSGLVQRWKQVKNTTSIRRRSLLPLLLQVYWPPENECSDGASGGIGTTAVVSVTDMQGSFVILVLGCIFSLLVLIAEFLLSSCCGGGRENFAGRVQPTSVKPFTA